MDSDEDFKHYSSCYYDDDADRAFYPENAHQHQLDNKSWFDSDKIAVTQQHVHCPSQQLILDNIVSSSDKIRISKSVERWTELPRNLSCDVETNNLRSVSIHFTLLNDLVHHYIAIINWQLWNTWF